MPNLRDLLAAHPALLLIDSSSSTIQVGLLRASQPPVWETSTDEAGSAIFTGTEKLLARASLGIGDLGAFVFCDGPGSVLGIRTAAMAVRTWNVLRTRPVCSFCSLTVLAHFLVRTENLRDFSVIADARRESWHRITIDASGVASSLQRVPAGKLAGSLIMPEGFRHWSPMPAGVRVVPYQLPFILPRIEDLDFFDHAPEPDAFLHEEPSYQTWTPQVHRAPS
jgi:tRNA threonylcarbamoyladenosine biosynthesis protein TsaB